MIIEEQEKVLANKSKNMLVSASAGSGKTFIMIKYIAKLICENKVPVNNFLVLTFTKAAASEMKDRLLRRLQECGSDQFIIDQIDALSIANISTIHSFCEKSLKKYANLLGINENFAIADENTSQKIRRDAFDGALKNFEKSNNENYNELLSAFKNNKAKIKDILFEIEKLANAVADKDEFLQKNLNDPEKYFKKASSDIFDNAVFELKNLLFEVEGFHVLDFEVELKESLRELLNSKDIFEFSKFLCDYKFPTLPKRKEVGDEVVENLKVIRANIVKILEKIEELQIFNQEKMDKQKLASLENSLIKLYYIYENEENSIKISQNLLDFYDLEKYMKILSEKENLFTDIKYVFVDEYQDTNKVQERIIKNIAKNCNFVAVGDVKQGIYGFRLASSEIFLKDLESFEANEDSQVNYLQSNFRSDKKVLNFVNDIFKVCMTQASAGVDYERTSMLNGLKEFESDDCKAVNIDIIIENVKEQGQMPEVYSVLEGDVDISGQSNYLDTIRFRINEVLESKIYDDGKFRRCKFSDIAILARKRDDMFSQLETYLQQHDIPIFSNSRSLLVDDNEIKVLINYLKIALGFKDEVALVSVLTSALCGFGLDELVCLKKNSKMSLYDLVMTNENGSFDKFFENFSCFLSDVETIGVAKAFENLFDKTNYRAYLNLLKNGQKKNVFVDKFLSEIGQSGLDFDLVGLVNYFETVDITVAAEPSAMDDAILLTTIHNSKGLEYPIVFLIGCDQSMKKSVPKVDVEINEEYGLAVKQYDQESNSEIVSVRMRAIQNSMEKKNFAEEMMIFYVALTRAKNRLYLFGKYNEKMFEKFSLRNCDSYLDLILFALKDVSKNLQNNQIYEDENMRVCIVDQVSECDVKLEKENQISKIDEKIKEKIKNYLNFTYKFDNLKNFKLKETVTRLSQKDQENALAKYSSDSFNFSNNMVDIGNAYHLALKVLNFEDVETMADLESQIKSHIDLLKDAVLLIDKNVLLRNVLLLKDLTKGAKVFKEKEFIMKDTIENLLADNHYDDKVLVQGIIDLFAIRDGKVILVDYKYSNSNSEQYLIEKYINQLKLYKLAIKNAINMEISQIYLLSLKNSKLIKVDL